MKRLLVSRYSSSALSWLGTASVVSWAISLVAIARWILQIAESGAYGLLLYLPAIVVAVLQVRSCMPGILFREHHDEKHVDR